MKIAITTMGSCFRSMCLCVVERMTLDAVKVVNPGAPEEDVLDEEDSRAPGARHSIFWSPTVSRRLLGATYPRIPMGYRDRWSR